MTTDELLKNAGEEKVSQGTKYAYMVIKDCKWGKAGRIFWEYHENSDGTVDERDVSGATWGTYKIGEEAVLVARDRKQTITVTFRLAN